MASNQSTLNPSEINDEDGGAGRAPGLLHLFSSRTPVAQAIPFAGDAIDLGRDDDAADAPQDLRMSRRHARVRFDGRRFSVEDLGSQNGTWADGDPVPPGAPRPVQRIIRAGDSLYAPTQDVQPFVRYGVKVEGGFVRGPALQAVLAEVAQAARIGATLHVHGESGTGKEGIARAFHEASGRAAGPFVAVNCATIPEGIAERLLFGARRGAFSGADADAQGYFQMADGGTLFLDEAVELDLEVQAKLLRALETKEVMPLGAAKPRLVDVCVCSATNKELRALVASGRLREDLYFRISRPEVTLPPLRDRLEEIPLLVTGEAARVAPALRVHVSLVEACILRPWPGNVRELLAATRTAVQSALLQQAKKVEARHLDAKAGTAFALPTTEEEQQPARRRPPRPPIEAELRARIEEALRQQHGNVTAAARALGMHRNQLRRLLERHDIPAWSDDDPSED